MGDWARSRLLYAVEFVGSSLHVQAMTMQRGQAIQVLLSTRPRSLWDSDLSRWLRGGYDYSTSTSVEAVWTMPGEDPWAACSTWRALPVSGSAPSQPARFCGTCGAARGDGFVFCGECGARFDAPATTGDPVSILRAIAANPSMGSRNLARLIDDMGDNSNLTPEARQALIDLIASDFADMSVQGPIDGTQPSSGSTLTVATAQDIGEALSIDRALTASEAAALSTLVQSAPWTFGYWGAMKAFLKRGPRAGEADLYATAVARLSSTRNWTGSKSQDFESVGFLAGFVDVASSSTHHYLARRVRRDLAALAEFDPGLYARISARLLIEWDESLSAWAFAPAHVMLGGGRTLGIGSQVVDLPADMSSRADAHPEIWNTRLDLVADVFSAVRRSPEAHTWAYQVLEANGRAPRISAESIGISMSTTYPPLYAVACAALPDLPEVFGALTSVQWKKYFTSSDASSFDRTLDQLTGRAPVQAAVIAGQSILEESSEAPVDRRARLAVLYLAGTAESAGSYYRPGWSRSADVSAVVAIGEAYHFDPPHLWVPILQRLDSSSLTESLFQLRGVPLVLGHLSPLVDAIVTTTPAWQAEDVAHRCLQAAEPEVSDLAWRLIDANGGLDVFLPALARWATDPDASAGTVSVIVRGAFDRADADQSRQIMTMAIDAPQLKQAPATVAGLVLRRADAGPIIWAALASPHADQALAVATSVPELTSIVGDSVLAAQIAGSTDVQLAFLHEYVGAHPQRIQRDAEFGAALARSLNPDAQRVALRQLQEAGHVPIVWMQLAESAMPSCVAVAAAYVESQRAPQALLDAVLACLDSQVPAAREIGLRILTERQAILEDPRLWQALAESDEPTIQRMVAEEALARGWGQDLDLADFDRRVLSGRRRARAAKESVKTRLAGIDPSGGSVMDPDRMRALLEMARGANARDREWALSRIASLSMHGIDFPEVDVSATTIGGAR